MPWAMVASRDTTVNGSKSQGNVPPRKYIRTTHLVSASSVAMSLINPVLAFSMVISHQTLGHPRQLIEVGAETHRV